jgi:hypothetical protein
MRKRGQIWLAAILGIALLLLIQSFSWVRDARCLPVTNGGDVKHESLYLKVMCEGPTTTLGNTEIAFSRVSQILVVLTLICAFLVWRHARVHTTRIGILMGALIIAPSLVLAVLYTVMPQACVKNDTYTCDQLQKIF